MDEQHYDPLSYGTVRLGSGQEGKASSGDAASPEDLLFDAPEGASQSRGAQDGAAEETGWELPDDIGHPLAGGGPDMAMGPKPDPAAPIQGSADAAFGSGRADVFESAPSEASTDDPSSLDPLLAADGPAGEASLEDLIGASPTTLHAPAQETQPPAPELAQMRRQPEPAVRPEVAARQAAPAPLGTQMHASPPSRPQPVQRAHTGDSGSGDAVLSGRSKLDMMAMVARRRRRAKFSAALVAVVGFGGGAALHLEMGHPVLAALACGLGLVGGLFTFVLLKD